MKTSDKTSQGGKRKRDESDHGVSPSPASRQRFRSTGSSGTSPIPATVRAMAMDQAMQEKHEAQKGKQVVDERQGEKRDMPRADECLRLKRRFGSAASGSGFSNEAGAADFAAILAWIQTLRKKKGAGVVEEEAESQDDKSEESFCWKSQSHSWVPAQSKVAVIPFPTPARRLHPRPRHILSELSEEEEEDDDYGPVLPVAREGKMESQQEEKSAPASVAAEKEQVALVVKLVSASPAPAPEKKKSVRGKRQRNVDTSDDDWEKDEVKRKRAKRKEVRNQHKEVTEKKAETARKVAVKRSRKLHTVTNGEDGKGSRMCDMCWRNNGEEVVYCQECKFHLCFACLDCHICSWSD